VVWKALLRVGQVDVDEYIELVMRGVSVDDGKIRKDASRTLKTNTDFRDRVPEDSLSRILNAFVHYRGNHKDAYVQSMSVLMAPFLFLMPEPDAFASFRTLIENHIPEYVRRYAGPLRGCQLLNECLDASHPALHATLNDYGLTPEVYAFSSVSSLNACVPPLADTLHLWDFQLAFGPQWAIIFVLARMLIASNSILAVSKSGNAPLITRELEAGFGIRASQVIERALAVAATLDRDLLNRLGRHAIPSASGQSNNASIDSLIN